MKSEISKIKGVSAFIASMTFLADREVHRKNPCHGRVGRHPISFLFQPIKNMLLIMTASYLLAACAEKVPVFTPQPVDMPIALVCPMPDVPKPPDLLADLKSNASVTAVMQACLRQTLLDKSYQMQLESGIKACR